MDIRKVKKLIELLEESNIDEIEIKEGEESVRISRNGAQSAAASAAGWRRAASATPSHRVGEIRQVSRWAASWRPTPCASGSATAAP